MNPPQLAGECILHLISYLQLTTMYSELILFVKSGSTCSQLTCWQIVVSSSSKSSIPRLCQTSVTVYQSTRHNIQEHQNLHRHQRKNFEHRDSGIHLWLCDITNQKNAQKTPRCKQKYFTFSLMEDHIIKEAATVDQHFTKGHLTVDICQQHKA